MFCISFKFLIMTMLSAFLVESISSLSFRDPSIFPTPSWCLLSHTSGFEVLQRTNFLFSIQKCDARGGLEGIWEVVVVVGGG